MGAGRVTNGGVSAQDLLDSLPFFAMVLNAEHQVVMANTLFARETDTPAGACMVDCFAAMHGTTAPHPDCPLTACLRTNAPAEREVADSVHGALRVSVFPLVRSIDDPRLFLHLARPA